MIRTGSRFCTSCGLETTEVLKETMQGAQRDTADNKDRGSSDPLVGRTLDSKYEIVAPLGEGGMGAVYRARRLHIGDEVAVKVLHSRFLPDEGAVERFRREARSAALLAHPNIVTIHDFSDASTDGSPAYIVMELVRGASLRGLIRREGRLDERRAVELMGDICAGVGAGHRQGVVHRDLKPDNVIIMPPTAEGGREVAKVVDFGIAKLRDTTGPLTLTQAGAMLGTPSYMPPEQCRGEQLGPSADVYSLGAMLYEMLTGVPPFRADNVPAMVSQHLMADPPRFPPELNLSPALEAVYLRALAKDPAARQPDANIFQRELKAALSEVETPAVRAPVAPADVPYTRPAQFLPTPSQTPTEPSRRWPLIVGSLILLLVCAVVVVPLALYALSKNAPPTSSDLSHNQARPSPTGTKSASGETTQTVPDDTDETAAAPGLKGKWTGTYGPLGQAAALDISEVRSETFTGVLEQNGVRVALEGSFKGSTREVVLKETRVLSGKGWVLGENRGTLATDGKRMSGTGRDSIGAQLGISYQWSFAKR